MKKVLLLNPPGTRKYLRDCYCNSVAKGHYLYHPMDLVTAGALLRDDFEISGLDALALSMDRASVIETIANDPPYAILGLTSWASWFEDSVFYKELKERTGSTIILSGSQVLYNPGEFLAEASFIDALALNYLGTGLKEYLEYPSKTGIQNIFSRNDLDSGSPVRRESMPRMFSVPPQDPSLFPYQKYRAFHSGKKLFASIIASEGCPFRCSFCIYGIMGYSPRDPGNVLEEMRYLRKTGIKEFYFRDYTFGADKNQLRSVLKDIRRSLPDIGWSCQTRPDILDPSLLAEMKASGCHTLLVGYESGNDEILRRANKGATVEDGASFNKECRRLGIRTVGYFILGLPGESNETAEATINHAISLDCDFAAFSVATPIPGTNFFYDSEIKFPLDKFETADSFPLSGTTNLSRKRIWELRNRAIRRFYFRPSFIIRKLFSSGGFKDLFELSREAVWLAMDISPFKKKRRSSE